MLLNIVMKNLLFAAWKNSSRPKIGQFELIRNMDFSDRSIDEIKGRVEYYCDDGKIERMSKAEIQNALEFLQSGYLDIVGEKEDKFFLKFNQRVALKKLLTFTGEYCVEE